MTHPFRLTPHLLSAAVLLSACGTETLTSVASEAAALTTAQCTYQDFRARAGACFDTFKTCQAAAGAVLADCKTALDACLPPPPGGSHPGHAPGGGGCSGSHDGLRPPNPDGGLPPPPPPGGLPPPGGIGGRGPGGGGERRPPPFAIDSAALKACHDAVAACVAADPTAEQTCRQIGHECVRAAFRAEFEARCTADLATCAQAGADATACARITQRCEQGVDGRPPSPDGGTCAAE